jgi:hypothetical protein
MQLIGIRLRELPERFAGESMERQTIFLDLSVVPVPKSSLPSPLLP